MLESPFAATGAHLPLIAILRGLTPEQAPAIGRALYDAGLRMLEVPLNRAGALQSIAALRQALPADAWIGAGTVLSVEQVRQVAATGATLILSPHLDAEVVRAARRLGLWVMPGVATPTEAFAALQAGAHALKAFPNDTVPPAAVKAWKTVLPPELPIYPVGGVTPASMAAYKAAGATGLGIGSALYRPEDSAAQVAQRAAELVACWRNAGR